MSTYRSVLQILGRKTVHPFPARMAPELALQAISQSNSQIVIVDPMAGSGTVLAIAQQMGHCAIGVDIDPLAVLIAKVWTTPVNRPELQSVAEAVIDRARVDAENTPFATCLPDWSGSRNSQIRSLLVRSQCEEATVSVGEWNLKNQRRDHSKCIVVCFFTPHHFKAIWRLFGNGFAA